MTNEEKIQIVRQGVKNHIEKASFEWDYSDCMILDVAPQNYLGAKEYFKRSRIDVMDIDPSNGDIIHDICKQSALFTETYDCIICTEVLEHTTQPFNAAKNLMEWLKPNGELYLTTPFNFFIHYNPIDCWRFTEQGLKELFKGHETIITKTGEELDPIQYQVIVKK